MGSVEIACFLFGASFGIFVGAGIVGWYWRKDWKKWRGL